MSGISELPERPLTVPEADKLVESGEFAPLSIKLVSPQNIDEVEQLEDSNAIPFVYSLLHATENKGMSVGYSTMEGKWKKIIEISDESYDHEVIEQETHQWVMEHNEDVVDLDAGLVDMNEMLD